VPSRESDTSVPGPRHGPNRGFDATACVIGAGAAGLAAGHALARRGIAFDWFEKGSMVGGLWRIDNDNGGSAAYSTLHLNSSRTRTQYPSYPMPAEWPDYPSHTLMAQYFQAFAEDNDLLRRITFRAEVTSVVPLPGPGHPGAHGWAVTTSATGRRTYQHVLVANGHHSVPRLPELPGSFTGRTFHAHDYRDPDVFRDRDVVVVGVGNSGMDLACDAARVARSVHLVTRHGVHVLPKYVFGRPIDLLSGRAMGYLPFTVERLAYEAILRLSTGRPQDRGLPTPDHRLLSAHPTVSAELYDRVGHGDIVMKPGIERLDGDTIHFADGTSVHADLLVHATGYTVSLPFLAPDIVDPRHNAMPLYQRVVHPQRIGLWFIGFVQTVGSGIPLCEYQSEWVGDLITGEAVLPDEQEMTAWIDADQAAMRARYVSSDRHTMQVDYWRYIRAMKEARARKPHPSLRDRVLAPLAGLR
jgi:dimethylaniline monooxygenase (N-oxide forming)